MFNIMLAKFCNGAAKMRKVQNYAFQPCFFDLTSSQGSSELACFYGCVFLLTSLNLLSVEI